MMRKMQAGMAVAAGVMLVTAGVTIFSAQSAQAQEKAEVSVRGQEQFSADRSPKLDSPSTWEVPFSSGGHVRLMPCSSDVEVAGTDEERIQVHVSKEGSGDISEVRVSFKKKGDTGTLHISGCPHNNFHIAVGIPRNSDLYLRMFAGDLNIRGVNGNKDVEIHAGDLNLSVGDASQYGKVDLSVTVGDLDASPFNVSKDGFFRSWHRNGSGTYNLYAHVGAGDLTLQ